MVSYLLIQSFCLLTLGIFPNFLRCQRHFPGRAHLSNGSCVTSLLKSINLWGRCGFSCHRLLANLILLSHWGGGSACDSEAMATIVLVLHTLSFSVGRDKMIGNPSGGILRPFLKMNICELMLKTLVPLLNPVGLLGLVCKCPGSLLSIVNSTFRHPFHEKD